MQQTAHETLKNGFQLEATIGQSNFHHLSNVWCLLISQPLTKKKVFEARRDGLFHVLQVLQQVFPVYNVAFVKDCLLPILTLEASLLEAEKVRNNVEN